MEGLLPEGLAAGLQVGVDGFLAAYEVGHFRPDFPSRPFSTHLRLPAARLEAVVDEVFLGRVSLLDLVLEHFFLRVLAASISSFCISGVIFLKTRSLMTRGWS